MTGRLKITLAFAATDGCKFSQQHMRLASTNLVKLGGCALLLAQVHPLFADAVVWFGAAAYSPAK